MRAVVCLFLRSISRCQLRLSSSHARVGASQCFPGLAYITGSKEGDVHEIAHNAAIFRFNFSFEQHVSTAGAHNHSQSPE